MRAAWQTIHPAVLPRDLTRFPSPHDSGAGFLYGLDNMTEMTATEFDYSRLDEDTATKLEYYATTGRALIRKSQIEFIAQLGEILSDARKVLANNKNGTFEKWATVEFDIGKQTVWNYVNAWDRILSNGWTIYSNLSPRAMYLLASEDTPKPIQKKLERLAAENGTVKRADVQRLIDAAKQKPAPAKPPSKTVEAPASDAIADEEDGDEELDAVDGAAEEPTSTASIVLDTLDREIPAKFRAAHELSVTLMSIGRELDKYRQRAKELSEQPGGEWLQMQLIDTEVRGLKARFQDAIYHTVCLQCAGKGCQKCQQNGWLPDFMKGMI